MRTNVVLNDELLEEAAKLSTASTKSALIEEALRVFVETRTADFRRRDYERRARDLQRRLAEISPRESATDIIRRDRERT
jgi:Arc/MetJ family transcription regulator